MSRRHFRRLAARAVLPVLEPLDPRRLLAASLAHHRLTLHIAGTSGDDVITIGRDPADAARVLVVFNGFANFFEVTRVQRVWVGGEAGHDRIEIVGEDAAPLGLSI